MSSLLVTEPTIAGHDPSPAFQFTPGARAFDSPGDTKPEDWSPEPLEGRERYAPRYAKMLEYLDHQLGVFRRGDSCVVVAAYDLSKDTALAGRPARAALVRTRSEREVVVSNHETRLNHPDVLVATTPCSRQVLSLAVVAPVRRGVARARYGLSPDENARMSDLLLLEGADSLPSDLAAAVPHALATARVRADRPLGLFWEVQGLSPAGEQVTTSLTVTRQKTGWLRRAIDAEGPKPPPRGELLGADCDLKPPYVATYVAGRS